MSDYQSLWQQIGSMNSLFGEPDFDHDQTAAIRWKTAEALAFKAAHAPDLDAASRETLANMARHELNAAVALQERMERRRF